MVTAAFMFDGDSFCNRWEVKFAPQLATATRRTLVVTSDVMNYMNQFSNENQLRTAMGGGGQSEAQPPKKDPVPQHVNKTANKPAPVSEAEESVEFQVGLSNFA